MTNPAAHPGVTHYSISLSSLKSKGKLICKVDCDEHLFVKLKDEKL